jgi:hypothetical protein
MSEKIEPVVDERPLNHSLELLLEHPGTCFCAIFQDKRVASTIRSFSSIIEGQHHQTEIELGDGG